jgi:uncharacterized protein (TIGR00725 family)
VTTRTAVAVVGPADTDDPELLAGAEQIGAALAAAGIVVVTGGLGGAMAAAARGASGAGGLVVGILPGSDVADANPWVDVALPSAMGEGRNALVARSATVVVAIGGSWGTLSELAMARRAGTPVVSWRGWHVDDAHDPGLLHVSSPDEAIAATLAALDRPSR